jgi:adenosylcobinamide kinase/adenosylcobinamide-phosphate guanylyltransferase
VGVTLITGGARSGKSAYAQQLAVHDGRSVAYVATAQALDAEFERRIARHRAGRPAHWRTIEESLDLASAVQTAWQCSQVVLVDDLTLWTSNVLLRDAGDPDAPDWLDKLEQLEAHLQREVACACQSVPEGSLLLVVSQEVGLGIVPAYPLGRAYRDLLGRVNQRVAAASDAVYLLVAGLALDVKRLAQRSPG